MIAIQGMGRLRLSWTALVAMLLPLLAGCVSPPARHAVPVALVAKADIPGMPGMRFWGDEVPHDIMAEIKERMPAMKSVAISAERVNGRPVINYLALSGGGDNGAFGAGVLIGWSERGTRPRFEVVTGVSTGAIIAVFAFLGKSADPSLREVFTQYATQDLLKSQLLEGLFGGDAIADSSPLAALIAKYVDQRLLEEVAAEYRAGRMLLIGTTNLDAKRPVVWNMGEIAASGNPDALALFRKVILASASIPGVFPPVHIKVTVNGKTYEEMHVDGGPTRQVFLAPSQLSLRAFDRLYDKPPLRRFYIIRNAKLVPDYQPPQSTALAISAETITTLILNQGKGDLLRIYTTAKRDGAEFYLAAIQPQFRDTPKEAFDRAYMQALFKYGEQQARSGYPWMRAPPELEMTAAQ